MTTDESPQRDRSPLTLGAAAENTHGPARSAYRTLLLVFALLAILLGGILAIVGGAEASGYASIYSSDNPLRGFPQLVWGGSIAALGFLTLVAWLVVSAITYRPIEEHSSIS